MNYRDYLGKLVSPLSEEQILSFFYQMARAIGVLHYCKIFHRYICAANFIVLTTERGNKLLKLRNLYDSHTERKI